MKIYFLDKKKVLASILGIVIIIFICLFLLVLLGHRAEETLSFNPVYKGPGNEKVVSFTCNVDWGNEHIPGMLGIFKQESIRATFFVTGRWADKYPELLKGIYDEGHIIGNHGYSHKDHSKLTYEQNLNEISMAQQAIERVTGERPLFFAPPSGAFNEHTLKAARDLGYRVIMWSIDTIDWKRDGAAKIVERVNKKLHNGGIVLMHPTGQTVEALPVIIKNIRERGYQIISLDRLVEMIEKK